MQKATLTVKEAAEVLGISLPIMYQITEQEDFDALIRVGSRRKVILKSKFYQWMDNQTEKQGGINYED